MTDLEQKLNSGKVYQVIAQENQDPRFYEYLEKMEKYNTLGYTERAENEKQQILKELFAEIGNNSYIQDTVSCDVGRPACPPWKKSYISI
mgnify:CR=1 FL=1